MKKRTRWFEVGFVAGYILGTKAGRQRYEDLLRVWRKIRYSPGVRSIEKRVRTEVGLTRTDVRTQTNGADPARGYDALLLRQHGAPGLAPDVVFAAGQEPALYLYLRPREREAHGQ